MSMDDFVRTLRDYADHSPNINGEDFHVWVVSEPRLGGRPNVVDVSMVTKAKMLRCVIFTEMCAIAREHELAVAYIINEPSAYEDRDHWHGGIGKHEFTVRLIDRDLLIRYSNIPKPEPAFVVEEEEGDPEYEPECDDDPDWDYW